MIKKCECGCEQIPKTGNRFVRNHHAKLKSVRDKMSKSRIGKKHSLETRLKMSMSQKGVKKSEGHKNKLRQSSLISMNKPEVKKRLKEGIKKSFESGRIVHNKNMPMKEETKEKVRETIKNKGGRSGKNNGNYGCKYTKEKSEKRSIRLKELGFGAMEKNSNWQGGISFIFYPKNWKDSLKEEIRKRDKYNCQLCKINQNTQRRKLDVHHIDYNKKNCEFKNLISLCQKCHLRVNTNRNYWAKYFKKGVTYEG
jgi:hypothetical protein